MTAKDSNYYARRAREERAKADDSDDPKIAAIHLELAIKFDALARVEANPTGNAEKGN